MSVNTIRTGVQSVGGKSNRLRTSASVRSQGSVSASASRLRAYVTCPARRDALYDTTFNELLKIGFEAGQIHRRRGIDMNEYEQGNVMLKHSGSVVRRVPEGLQKHTFLLWDFHKCFLPLAAAAFDDDPNLEVIFWVEDDVKMMPGVDAGSLLDAVKQAGAAITWLAFTIVKGTPTFGTHLAGISRDGVALALRELDRLEEEFATQGSRLKYLMGLDTFFKKSLRTSIDGTALVKAVPKSMARQRSHSFKGRR